MNEILEFYALDPDDFNLFPEDFDHASSIHGVGHVYRVMYHSLYLGYLLGNRAEARLAFFAAFLHDLSRKHDGRCTEHGEWASDTKLPLYREQFIRLGASSGDIEKIRTAVFYHSLPAELSPESDAWTVTAILKDADALDRIRLGEYNLDTRYLRFAVTKSRVEFARALYYASFSKPFSRFSEMIRAGEKLESGFQSREALPRI